MTAEEEDVSEVLSEIADPNDSASLRHPRTGLCHPSVMLPTHKAVLCCCQNRVWRTMVLWVKTLRVGVWCVTVWLLTTLVCQALLLRRA